MTHNHKVGDEWWRVYDWVGYRPILDKMFVVHTTPSGVYLAFFPPFKPFDRKDKGQKLVILAWKKKYAYPTKAEAIEAYWWRKQRQVIILEQQLRHAKECLDVAEKSRGGDVLLYPKEEDVSFGIDFLRAASSGVDNAEYL